MSPEPATDPRPTPARPPQSLDEIRCKQILVEFSRKFIVVTNNFEDYVEVEILRAMLRWYTGMDTCHNALGRHLSGLGVRACTRRPHSVPIRTYRGLRLAGDYWGKLIREREKREWASVEKGGYFSAYSESPFALIQLTAAHLSIPPPQSDNILVMVPANINELAAPPPPPPSPPPLQSRNSPTLFSSPPTLSSLPSPMLSFEALSPVTPNRSYIGEILEALDILDDFIAKGNVREAVLEGEARTETRGGEEEGEKEENQGEKLEDRKEDKEENTEDKEEEKQENQQEDNREDEKENKEDKEKDNQENQQEDKEEENQED